MRKCILLPEEVANVAEDLFSCMGVEVFSTIEEFIEEEGYEPIERYKKFNTEEFKNSDFILLDVPEESFDKVLSVLDDWKFIAVDVEDYYERNFKNK